MKIAFELNGKPTSLEIEPRETLAEVLRARCRLTGVKLSCESQVCGTCTVLVDDIPVSACTYLAYEIRDKHVTTIEGLVDGGRLHPVQQAFLDNFAFQCGFCTPGMIMSSIDIVNRKGSNIDEQTIREELEGNICRCTGYHNIVKSVAQGAREMAISGAAKAAE